MIDRNRVVREDIVETPGRRIVSSVEHNTVRVPSERERRLATLARIKQVIYFIASAFAVLILLRFVLLALGANPANAFANLVYGLSGILVAPFNTLFGYEPQFANSVIEISSLVAIAVYYLLAWGIAKIVALSYAPPDPTGQAYE